jgi:hypothetical protein
MGSSVPAGIGCRQRGHNTAPSPFAMDADTFRGLGCLRADCFADYLDKFPQEPVYRPLPTEIRQSPETMPIPWQWVASEDVIDGFLRTVQLLAGHKPAEEGARCAA